MSPTNLVALLACLSTVPACAVSTGSPGSGDPPAPVAQVAAAGDWSCVLGENAPAAPPSQGTTSTPPSTSRSFTVHLSEAYTSVDVGRVQVTACDALDEACAEPLAQAQADDYGLATLNVAGGVAAFGGYLRVSGPGMTDNYVFLAGRALSYGDAALDLVVYTPSALAITADTLAGVPLDPQRGTVRVEVRDCAGALASGVAVTLGSDGAIASTQYFVGDGAALSSRADATDASGVALGLGVSPGAVGVAAKLEGRPFGAMGFVYAGAVTSLVVRP
jgi:hypothetical protein